MDKTETNEGLEKKDENRNENSGTEKTRQPENEITVDQEDPIEKLQEELDGAKDKYIRLYSEFENFRKRTVREKGELIQSANEQLIKTLLPVADDFERAENAFQDKNDKNLAGFFLIHSKFKKVLELYGVKPMDADQGADFNPDFHEAISQLDAPVSELKGKIIEVVEKGYLLNDKVIRYAKVVVGK